MERKDLAKPSAKELGRGKVLNIGAKFSRHPSVCVMCVCTCACACDGIGTEELERQG